MPDPVCARCRGHLQKPGATDLWTCGYHGAVEPLHAARPAESHHLHDAAVSSGVPMWVPWPLPPDWVLAGVRSAGGTGRSRAVAVAIVTPGLASRQVELVVVSEEPGVGLGASYAGLDTSDPGPEVASLPFDTKVAAGGHPTPMWSLPVSDRAVYVGEALGRWLWLIAWPVSEWMVVHDDLRLVDVREPVYLSTVGQMRSGPLSPRLSG